MTQSPQCSDKKLGKQILDFGRHVAGSSQIVAAYICDDYILEPSDRKATGEVLLVVHAFQPKVMNYVKTFDDRNFFVFVVDQGVFEMDVDRGFLGEALANGLLFPYSAILDGNYLHVQEVKLKKRLILELLENLVLGYPELSYQICIKPEYFMYEAMLSRARLFPLMIHTLQNFMQKKSKKENVKTVFSGYSDALRELEKEEIISFSEEYVQISRNFVDETKSLKVRFVNLFRPTQKALFTSLLGIFPKIVNFLSQNRELFAKLQRVTIEDSSKIIHQIEDPQAYLYIPTARGFVPLASRLSIRAFAKKVLSADRDEEIIVEKIGGVLNDAFLIKTFKNGEERRVVVKRFKDWSSFKWFPLSLWTVGTRTFAVLGRSRLERECTINQLLHSKGFAVPKLLYVNHVERLIFMEFLEGESVEKVVKRATESKNTREIKKCLDVICRVGEKIAEVHCLDIALGDTKPENILIGKNEEIYLMDFEQASRNGDKVWDIAEFLYYTGHYISPFVSAQSTELITKAFIEGYLRAGGNADVVKRAANPKYTKVFSVFTFPYTMFLISNICRKAGKLKE